MKALDICMIQLNKSLRLIIIFFNTTVMVCLLSVCSEKKGQLCKFKHQIVNGQHKYFWNDRKMSLFNRSRWGQSGILYVAAVIGFSLMENSTSCVLSLSDQDTQCGNPESNQLAELLISVLDTYFSLPAHEVS